MRGNSFSNGDAIANGPFQPRGWLLRQPAVADARATQTTFWNLI